MLSGRLRQLVPRVRDILAAAAVIGQEFDTWMLSSLAECDEETLLPMLRLAREALILNETDVAGSFAFIHPLAREAALGHLLRAEQAHTHGRLLTLLTAVPAVTTFSALWRVNQVPSRNCRHSHPTRFLSRCIPHLPFRTVRVRGSCPTGKSYLGEGVGAALAAHAANAAFLSATGSTSRFTKPALQRAGYCWRNGRAGWK